MHKYLRAIGFSDIRKKDLEIILKDIIEHPDKMTVAKDSEGNEFAEFIQTVSPGIGIAVRGTYDEEDEFDMEYYIPYFEGSTKTSDEIIEIERHIDKESYAGYCDDPRLGLTLIFCINDVNDVLSEYRNRLKEAKFNGVYLSALSTNGKVLLPIKQNHVRENYIDEEEKIALLEEASKGNEDAIEKLGIQEMNLYSIITRRVQKEDVLTIVSSYFSPKGLECELYGILADILDVREAENLVSEEHLYIIKVKCNGLVFDLCINKKDLTGIPAVGRRIKADIWLLGTVCK